MSKIPSVSFASAFDFPVVGKRVMVIAKGVAPTSGWSNPKLFPHFYITPPKDGYWEIDFVADQLSGVVLEVEFPLVASGIFSPPEWMKGIRIIAENNTIDITVDKSAKTIPAIPKNEISPAKRGNVLVRQQLASYDDSFNPIGFCSGLSIKMKKLRHTLTLVVEGPDEQKVRQCFAEAAGAGLVAAIIAAYATGGLGLQAAVSAFLSSLKGCLGDSFSVNVENDSYWIEWCT